MQNRSRQISTDFAPCARQTPLHFSIACLSKSDVACAVIRLVRYQTNHRIRHLWFRIRRLSDPRLLHLSASTRRVVVILSLTPSAINWSPLTTLPHRTYRIGFTSREDASACLIRFSSAGNDLSTSILGIVPLHQMPFASTSCCQRIGGNHNITDIDLLSQGPCDPRIDYGIAVRSSPQRSVCRQPH